MDRREAAAGRNGVGPAPIRFERPSLSLNRYTRPGFVKSPCVSRDGCRQDEAGVAVVSPAARSFVRQNTRRDCDKTLDHRPSHRQRAGLRTPLFRVAVTALEVRLDREFLVTAAEASMPADDSDRRRLGPASR